MFNGLGMVRRLDGLGRGPITRGIARRLDLDRLEIARHNSLMGSGWA